MIYRPDFLLLRRAAGAGAFLLMVTGCSDPVPEALPIERARTALAAQDGLGAEIILRDMAARGAPTAQIAAFLGEAELQQGDLAEARRWLEAADFTPETRARGYQMLGRVEMASGQLAKAGKAFDAALQSTPDDPELWVDIGRLRYLGGEQQQAVEASLHAFTLGPDNVAAVQFHAQLVRDTQGLEAALPLYEAALQHKPDSAALLADYAATLGDFGRVRDMLTVVRRIAELDGNNSQVFYLQAVLAARAGKFDLARTLLARSGEPERSAPAGMLLSAIIDMQQGNYASASQMLDKLERMQPDNQTIRLLLAQSLARGENHRELVYRFKDRANLPGSTPYLTVLVGRSYEVLGRRDQAAPFLDLAAKVRRTGLQVIPADTSLAVALARGPHTGRDTIALVRGLIESGQTGAAIVNAQAYLLRAQGSADALALAGDAWLFAGEGSRAADYYARAAAIRQSWPLTRRMVAAEILAGRQQSALTLLEHAVTNNSANAEAAVMLADAVLRSGKAKKAAVLLDLVIANGAARNPDALILRARAAMELGDMQTARSTAMRAYSLQKMNPSATALLAEILAESGGDRAQSQALARKAAKILPP